MAAKIQDALGIQAKLIPEGRGVFDVVVDAKTIYSKHETGTFPDDDKLVASLVSALDTR